MNDRNISLRSLEASDESVIFEWMKGDQLRLYIGTRNKPDIRSHSKWFDRKLNDHSNINFIITFDKKPIGLIGTNVIDNINHNAEIFFYIGDTNYRNKGVASVAIQKFIIYLNENYHLLKINARVFDFNIGSQKLLIKNGFVYEGKQVKQVLSADGKTYYDLFWYAYFI
ncbi:GNAT family protein [Streptococcus uberis]